MGVLAGCTLDGGCPLNISCAYSDPSMDPIASTNSPSTDDVYDACLIAGIEAGGFSATDAIWMAELMKGQAMQEAGQIGPAPPDSSLIQTNLNTCGGENCGMWSISSGKASGDTSAGGVCGVTTNDPLLSPPAQAWSHSYALFQDTPGCEGTFLVPTLPAGYTLVGTGSGTTDVVPFAMNQKVFYTEAEVAPPNMVPDVSGKMVSGVIDAVTDPTDMWYGHSIFYPAYNLFVHMGYTFYYEYQQAQGTSTGCTNYQKMYKTVAYWLNGDISNDCNCPPGGAQGGDLNYVKSAISNYNMMYPSKPWPGPTPM
jgi:hypothetical protein